MKVTDVHSSTAALVAYHTLKWIIQSQAAAFDLKDVKAVISDSLW